MKLTAKSTTWANEWKVWNDETFLGYLERCSPETRWRWLPTDGAGPRSFTAHGLKKALGVVAQHVKANENRRIAEADAHYAAEYTRCAQEALTHLTGAVVPINAVEVLEERASPRGEALFDALSRSQRQFLCEKTAESLMWGHQALSVRRLHIHSTVAFAPQAEIEGQDGL
jgi:hypothetical protein